MKTLLTLVFVGMLTMFATLAGIANAIAGDNHWRQEMRQACNQNQAAGAPRQQCYDRYGLGQAPIFRDERPRKNRYREDEHHYHDEDYGYHGSHNEPRRRPSRHHHNDSIEEALVGLGLGLIIGAIISTPQPAPCAPVPTYDAYDGRYLGMSSPCE